MTQPQSVRAVNAAVAAIQQASTSALVLAVAAVALIGTGAGVAVSRTAGSASSPGPMAGPGSPSSAPVPTAPTTPVATPSTASGSPAAQDGDEQKELKSLLDLAFANALRQQTVHSVARNVSEDGTAVFVDDDAVNGGTQQITIHGGHVQIRVVGPKTYLTGDRRGLTRFFNFTDAQVKTLNHQWYPLVAGQVGYETTTAGVTLASTLEADRIAGRLTREADKTISGQRVYGISGRAVGAGAPKGADATMWIGSDSGLPVEFDADNGKQRLTQTFSDWGKPIHLAAPSNVFGQGGSSV